MSFFLEYDELTPILRFVGLEWLADFCFRFVSDFTLQFQLPWSIGAP
jgi:hypothetical protein